MAEGAVKAGIWVFVSAAVPLVGGAGGSLLLAAALRESGSARGWLYLAAGAAYFAAVAITVAAKLLESRRAPRAAKAKRGQLVTLRDHLMPFASTTADMALRPLDDREPYLRNVAGVAAQALSALVADHVERPRAVVYLLNADASPIQMESIGHSGRGERPRPFVKGTPRGDGALNFLSTRRKVVYKDLAQQKPEGYDGTMEDYATFISVPIWTDNGVYGMVSLDAPRAGTFDEGDIALAELTAELMSIAFEVGQDSNV